jgi:deazaflavin-dependent oxidoreductase (nitroreductase family)
MPTVAAGIPVLTVITSGAKSGMPRPTPLLGIPHGDDLAIIGTHFGQPGTPGWYYNLRANPSAEVVYHNKRVSVLAREAEGEEWRAIWDRARGIYSGYESYAGRIHDRPIHIMVLSESALL